MLEETGVDPMSVLFHEETAAVDAYRRAMAFHRGTSVAAELRDMFVNHREAAGLLRKHVRQAAPRSDVCFEAWSAIHGATAESDGPFVLAALKRGEECSRELYRKTLDDAELPPGGQSLIAAILLPQTERHVAVLNRLLA